MTKLYSFFDRREEEFISDRTLDDAITSIFKLSDEVQKDVLSWEDDRKIEKLKDAGFIVAKLPEIDTLVYQDNEHKPHRVQVDFNCEDKTLELDIGIINNFGTDFFELYFIDETNSPMTRVFSTDGIEHCIEWCSACEEEVFIPAEKKKITSCPCCGEDIIPCSLCEEHEMNCISCCANNK